MKTNKISIAMFVVLLSALVFASSAFSAAPDKEPKEPPLEKVHKFGKQKKDIEMYADGKLIRTDKEFVFLDDQGNIIKRKPVPQYLSLMTRDGKYLGSLRDLTPAFDPSKSAKFDKSTRNTHFTLMDIDGNKLWEADKVGESGDYMITSGNGGTLIVQDCVEGGCYVRIKMTNKDKAGVVINPRFHRETSAGDIVFSDDGNFFLEEYGMEHNSLVFFDINGNEIWDKTFENSQISSPSISAKGNFIIISVFSKLEEKIYIYIYSKSGNLLYKEEVNRGGYYFGFDEDETYCAAVSNTGSVYFYDLTVRKRLWAYKERSNNISFRNVDVGAGFLAIGTNERNDLVKTDADSVKYLYLFDYSGDLVHKKKIIGHGLHKWDPPQVKVLDNGRRVIVNLGDKVRIYKNEFAK